MKHLPKHLQPRWRYLGVAIETFPDATFDRRDLQRALWYEAQNLFGDAGSADLDLTVLRFEHESGWARAVVRTRRGEDDRARAVVATVTEVAGDSVGPRVRGVSGTVRACEEKYIRRGTEAPDQRQVVFERATCDAVAWGDRVDVRTEEGFAGATDLDLE